MKKLKKANNKMPTPPTGLPTSSMPDEQEVDPVLLSLSKLAELISPVNEQLAWDVLNEVVQSANRSKLDTSQGHIGFEPNVFRRLSERDDARTYQVANELKDRLERIVALANIYQGLSDREKKASSSQKIRGQL